jgi:PAS domain S-box-containing protein
VTHIEVDTDVCRAIVEGAPEAIVLADTAGTIRLWNAGAQAMFGYTKAEALDHSLDLIIPERFRERHWNGYQEVMHSGVSRYGAQLLAVPAVRKDGSRLSIEFHVVVLKNDTGSVTGIAAIIRDVTEHWERDRTLATRLKELESAAGS